MTEATRIDIPNPNIADRPERTVRFSGLSPRQKEYLQAGALGVGGITLGAATMALMTGFMPSSAASTDAESGPISNVTNRQADGLDVEVPVFTSAPFSEAATDDMSFSDAFGAARRDIGPGGFFEWRGNTYNTYYAEEWAAFSEEEQDEFMASVDYQHEETIDSKSIDQIIAELNDDSVPTIDDDIFDEDEDFFPDDEDFIAGNQDEEGAFLDDEEVAEEDSDYADASQANNPTPNESPDIYHTDEILDLDGGDIADSDGIDDILDDMVS